MSWRGSFDSHFLHATGVTTQRLLWESQGLHLSLPTLPSVTVPGWLVTNYKRTSLLIQEQVTRCVREDRDSRGGQLLAILGDSRWREEPISQAWLEDCSSIQGKQVNYNVIISTLK